MALDFLCSQTWYLLISDDTVLKVWRVQIFLRIHTSSGLDLYFSRLLLLIALSLYWIRQTSFKLLWWSKPQSNVSLFHRVYLWKGTLRLEGFARSHSESVQSYAWWTQYWTHRSSGWFCSPLKSIFYNFQKSYLEWTFFLLDLHYFLDFFASNKTQLCFH